MENGVKNEPKSSKLGSWGSHGGISGPFEYQNGSWRDKLGAKMWQVGAKMTIRVIPRRPARPKMGSQIGQVVMKNMLT